MTGSEGGGGTGEQKNILAGSGSIYLEQHADNPVHWRPWGEAAFLLAREKDKPLLVSIGYSTCHWCHVMAHESFEDDTAAAVMNRALVSVKVDREQHPGVDAIYMEAAVTLNGSGGWPLNVFIDHEGRPFLAVTYLPKDRWTGLIQEVSRLWREDRGRIHRIADSLTAHLTEERSAPGGSPAELPELLRESLRRQFDAENPGFVQGGGRGGSMKFPPSQSIDWLLEHGGQEGRGTALEILTAMMDSGLHDRVGGGFHRYSTDAAWRVPHFEKMTYDNAQLMGLYARAAALISAVPPLGPSASSSLSAASNPSSSPSAALPPAAPLSPQAPSSSSPPAAPSAPSAASAELAADLLAAARGTADWFLREMRVSSPEGEFLGYAAAADADDPLGEGTYFAWPPDELAEVLGPEDGAWLAERWNLSGEGRLPAGNYEPVAAWIPHPRGASSYPEACRRASDTPRETALTAKLRAAREHRPPPIRDPKVLTDQNALLLEGFVRLARYAGDTPAYREAARELADLLVKRNTAEAQPGTGELRSRVRRTQGIAPYITDYAYLAMALTGAYSLLGNPAYIHAAEAAAEEAVKTLGTGSGAYYAAEAGEFGLFKRPVEDFDGPAPAGQHALGIAFARLYTVTGNPRWKNRVEDLLTARAATAKHAPSGTPTLIRLASIHHNPCSMVIAGPEDHPRTRSLTQLIRSRTGPDIMVIPADESARRDTLNTITGPAGVSRNNSGAAPSPAAWAELKGRIGLKEPQLMVCSEGRCLLPAFTDDEALRRLEEIQTQRRIQ